ncbi:MAG: hypothetical protein EOO32_05750 [Comamonadaceae bacterium]|nr:MAG: hypothetical protein EOO32_05750 [Comamonadaceae bacterium]
MSATPPKAPPRFVPTLTDVVRVTEGDAAPLLPQSGTTGTAAPAPSSASPSVPWPEADRFVPVVPPPWADRPAVGTASLNALAAGVSTAWVSAPAGHSAPSVSSPFSPKADLPSSPSALDAVPPAMPAMPSTAAGAAAPALPHGFEEHLVHRVMQRVDVVLDQRLREAIATVVQEQTRSMVPRLREEVESVVRHAVYEAVAEELSGDRDPTL